MADYKPYPFLYKGVPSSTKITISFYVSIPTNERLTGPSEITETTTNTTTLTYGIATGSSNSPQLIQKEISWNRNRATVKIIIESGGNTLGSATVNSQDFE